MMHRCKPVLSAVALSLAMLSQGAAAAEEQFFPIRATASVPTAPTARPSTAASSIT